MEIHPLPEKKKITFFEVQYFVNEGKQGTAKNVLLVTYSTEPDRFRAKTDKSVQRRVRFDLSTGREIYRKAKRHLGAADGEAIKQNIIALKKEKGIITWFGLRQAHYATRHRYITGKSFHIRELDANNRVFVFIEPDNTFNVQFNWEGEPISIVITPHEGELSGNQSVGVGYYTSASVDAELREYLSAQKQQRQSAAAAETSVEIAASTVIAEDRTMDEERRSDSSEYDAEITEQSVATPSKPKSTALKRRTIKPKQLISLSQEDVFNSMCSKNVFTPLADDGEINLGTSMTLPTWLAG